MWGNPRKTNIREWELGTQKKILDTYLSESIIEDDGDFDILRWWKLNSEMFHVLSKLTRDVLVVHISNGY